MCSRDFTGHTITERPLGGPLPHAGTSRPSRAPLPGPPPRQRRRVALADPVARLQTRRQAPRNDRVRGPRPGAHARGQGDRDRSQRAQKGGPRAQPERPDLPRPEPVPGPAGQDLCQPEGPDRPGGARLLPLPGLSREPRPRRRRVGGAASTRTPGAEDIATLAGTCDSFADAAAKLVPKRAGLRLSESTVARTTEAAGERRGTLWGGGPTLGTIAGSLDQSIKS